MSHNSVKQNSPSGQEASGTMEQPPRDAERSMGSGIGPILSPRQYGGLLMALSAIGVAVAAIVGVRDGMTLALGIIMGTCVVVLLVWMLAIRRPG
jgi:hypothetical protein